MFIKVKSYCDKSVLINADKIVIIEEPKHNDEGCTIYFSETDGLRTKHTMNELETLLDANSIDKIIEALKQENTRLRIQQNTQDAIGKMVNTK